MNQDRNIDTDVLKYLSISQSEFVRIYQNVLSDVNRQIEDEGTIDYVPLIQKYQAEYDQQIANAVVFYVKGAVDAMGDQWRKAQREEEKVE